MKKTKIVGTIGPASADPKILDQLIKAGLNVARLNFSHGSHQSHQKLISDLRKAATLNKANLAIMQDLQGPRLRVAKVDDRGIELIQKEKVILASNLDLRQMNLASFKEKVVPIDYQYLADDVKVADRVLISDGLIQLQVEKVHKRLVYAQVLRGGLVFSHKGINIPGVKITAPVITKKDKEDLRFGLKQKVDFVALSFVACAQDILDLKKLIKKYSPQSQVKVVAKIERMAAFKDREKIIEVVDAVMVARGDLGIEIPDAKVPLVQKELITACIAAGKPVIVATQMLDSMINYPKPTRAEVADVANAVVDGTDAVMLSGETAFGKYPVESVEMMRDIIEEIEASPFQSKIESHVDKSFSSIKAMADSAFHLAHNTKAKLIVVFTQSGFTAQMIARYRPDMPIVALTGDEQVARQLALVWSVDALVLPEAKTINELIKNTVKILLKNKKVVKKDKIVIVASQPLGYKQAMNWIKLEEI